MQYAFTFVGANQQGGIEQGEGAASLELDASTLAELTGHLELEHGLDNVGFLSFEPSECF